MVKTPYQIRISQDLLEKIRNQAQAEQRSINNMIEVLLNYGLIYSSIKEENAPVFVTPSAEQRKIS